MSGMSVPELSDCISSPSTPTRSLPRPPPTSLFDSLRISSPTSHPHPDRPHPKVGASVTCSTADGSCNTDVMGFQYSFSPKLCMELLPTLTKAQLDFEYEYFYQNFRGFATWHGTRKPGDIAKQQAIYRQFVYGLNVDIERYVHNLDYYSKLTEDFSCTIESLKTWLSELEQNTAEKRSSSIETIPTSVQEEQVDTQPDSEPVWFLPFSVCANVQDICEGLEFRTVGNRKCVYFGARPYEYKQSEGLVRHEAAPFPESGKLRDVLDNMCEKITDSDFNLDNFTCLITLYDDNSSHLPYHSDDENCIRTDSIIYTVSLGDSRSVHFRTKDRSQFRSCVPNNGSVYCMSRQSQEFWEHSVPKSRKPVKPQPRVSLTLRYLIDTPVKSLATPQPLPLPQPNLEPGVPCPRTKLGSSPSPIPRHAHAPHSPIPKRVLFLTDSIHAKFNEKNFEHDIVCDKRLCFRLRDITQFEKNFGEYDIILFSCGVNDLLKDGHSAFSLISVMGPKLESYSKLYPNTCFIYNSILITDDSVLNREIDGFNSFIFNLSLKIDKNVWFLDTHHILWESRLQNILYDGIHITKSAGNLLEISLIHNITGIFNNSTFTWPLRPSFTHTARQHRCGVGSQYH